jgi:hypothetical protein
MVGVRREEADDHNCAIYGLYIHRRSITVALYSVTLMVA